MQGQIRVMRSALESRLGVILDAEHVVWTWLVEYAGYLVNRGEVGHDGKTAYERSKGKVGKLPGFEFMESVLWKRRAMGGPLGKLTCMWNEGVSSASKVARASWLLEMNGAFGEQELCRGDRKRNAGRGII